MAIQDERIAKQHNMTKYRCGLASAKPTCSATSNQVIIVPAKTYDTGPMMRAEIVSSPLKYQAKHSILVMAAPAIGWRNQYHLTVRFFRTIPHLKIIANAQSHHIGSKKGTRGNYATGK